MKRIVIGAAIVLGLIGTANADSKHRHPAANANLPDCRGISSPEQIRSAKTAKADPAVAFAKKHRATAMPASVVCQSKLWQAVHGNVKVAASKRLSPDAQRALSRPSGSGRIRTQDSPVQAYVAPEADARPVDSVHAPPLENVHPITPPVRGDGTDDHGHPEPVRPVPPTESGGPDGPLQMVMGPVASAPTAVGSGFDGVGVGVAGFSPSSNPPDVNGHVGATQYVQWNNTSFAVFSKAGALLYGPAAGNTLFQSLGGVCATHNDGDPVVNYDILAGRWVLSQFAVDGPAGSASHQCVAVSVSDNALGSYYLYDFVTDTTNFVDYPHVGVWPDGYYMTAHVFNAAGTAQVAARVYVFERDKMILGQPARMQQKDLAKDGTAFQYGFLPADLDSVTAPPAGEAAFILGPNGQLTNQTDSTRVAVTWGVTPTITITSATITTVGIVSPPCVNNTAAQNNRDCVPQPSPAVGADDLDDIEFHFMYRLAYRNFGGSPVQESLVASAPTAGSTSTPGHGAIKWIEFRNAGNSTATPTVFQSGTFDPDTSYRWLPSAAMDKDHNIAIGYSKSSTSVKPGIYMTGRLGTDTLNTMGAETTVTAGIGSQTSGAGNRWGDYSAMTLDPVDQCTFWYTNEYLKTNGAFNWSTRIATYKFPSCTAAASWVTVSGTITACATGVPLSGVVVSLSNGFAGVSDASGNYSISVPAGTYTASAAGSGRNCTSSSPAAVSVIATSGATTTQNFCMSGSSNLQTNGFTIDDATNGNNNGVINRNECVKLTLPLKNNGCANETSISATLSTSTSGVTVTQSTSAYADLAMDASGSNTTLFQFQTSSSFVCGTTISFTLTANYASGSKALTISFPTCGGGANQTIPSSSLTAADLTQTDRLGRDGVQSTCANKTNAAGGFAGTKFYKTFTFTNNSALAACFTVNLTAALGGAGDIESAAYSPSYNPASITTNFLGDTGISGLGTTVGSAQYSVTVPALATFVIVVNTTGTTTSSVFSGTVSGFANTSAGPGACPACVPPATPAASNGGPYCAGGTIALSTPAVAGATYAWTGPNGFTSALQNPTRSTATVADAGTYSVTVTVSGCTSAAGTTTVVVNPAPATPTASNGGPYCTGATISLSTPIVAGATYAWTGPNGFTSALQNPTRATATTADAGIYSVTVTVSGCTSAAGTTNVVVNPIPAMPTASNGGPYCAGGTIALSTPTVAGATYAWTGPNGFTSALQNPTRATATAADAGTYSVTVTVSGCTSAAGTTTVVLNPAPATPTASNGGPYCAGATIALSTPTVAGATYAWIGPNGFISALQNPTRSSSTTADAGIYAVTVTVSGCTSAAGTTNVVVNAIPATPVITPGGPTTFCTGGSVLLTSSSGSGNQWFLDGNPIGGATSNTYSATATGSYTVVVTASGCSSAASTPTNVTVNPVPATPTLSPAGSVTFCFRDTVTLTSSSATGNQWSVEGAPLAGETGQTLLVTKDLISAHTVNGNNAHFTVTVTANGCSSTSAPKLLTVLTPGKPAILAAGPTSFCTGGSVELDVTIDGLPGQWYLDGSPIGGATSSSYVAAVGGSYTFINTFYASCPSDPSNAIVVIVSPVPSTPTITPGGPTTFCAGGSVVLTSSSASGNQWFLNGNAIGGATNNTYSATATGSYTVVATPAACSSAASAATSVTVNPAPATPTITPGGPTTFCAGGSVVLTSSSASGNQWLLNGNPIGGATSNTYSATATGSYTVVVTASGCSSAASSATVVTVNPGPSTPAITPMGATTFCSGGSVTLTASAAPAYQWFLDGGPISGATNQTYSASAIGSYTVQVTSAGCTAMSSAQTVTVNPLPPPPTIIADGPTTMCGSGSVTLTSSSATGNLWNDGGPFSVGTNQTLVVTTSGTYSVYVRDTNGCLSGRSNLITVTFNPVPNADIRDDNGNAGSTTICAGTSINLIAASTSGATYTWARDGQPIAGTAFIISVNQAGSYTNTVTANGCSATSSPFIVNVNSVATPAVTPGGPATFCAGGSVVLTSSSATGNQWRLNGNPIGGATSNTYSATATGNYTVTVTASGCTSAASAATAVTVNPIPLTPTITPGGPATFCTGGSVTLTSSSATGNQWFLNSNPIGGATNSTYSATAAGNYTVTVTANGCTSAASAATAVAVNPIPATPAITPGGPTTFCAGFSVTLTSSSASGNQWFLNGSPIGGATNQTYVASVAGDYSVAVTTSGCTSAASAATTITINPNPNATITAPASVVAGSTGNTASVANAGVGATYSWTVGNGTITAGTGTRSITITAGAAGTLTINVTVTTAATCSDSKSANVNVTAAAPAVTVTSVAPASGSTSGGTAVTINGSGFASGATVTFGGTAATNVVVVSAIKITATTPAHAAGSVNVTVTNTNASTATLTSGYLYAMLFDPNGDGVVDPADIFYLINYLFLSGPAPHGTAGMASGDANGDGVVDPADIFYLINYLFLGGIQPHAVPGTSSAASIGRPAPQIAGSIALGKPVRRAGHYLVPVIVTSRGEVTPQAMSLRVRLESDSAIGNVAIRRAGVAKDVVFETSRRSGNDVSYLVAYDPAGLALGATRSAVVAEIDIESADGGIAISIDPQLTLLGDLAGTKKATAANQRLELSGTTIGSGGLPRRRVPTDQVN